MGVARNQDIHVHLSSKSAERVKVARGHALMAVYDANPDRLVYYDCGWWKRGILCPRGRSVQEGLAAGMY